MGVTIHFEGQLKSDSEFDTLMEIANDFAEHYQLPYSFFKEKSKKLDRVKDEKDWDYIGPTKGIKIQPDVNSDPLWLEFDKDNYLQEYCKTQFSDTYTHLIIVDLLRKIEPFFKELLVFDEGEFWDTEDEELLKSHFDDCFKAIEDAKQGQKNLEGPFRLKDGRMIDLMEN